MSHLALSENASPQAAICPCCGSSIDKPIRCEYCDGGHASGHCPRVKEVGRYASGTIKYVTFWGEKEQPKCPEK